MGQLSAHHLIACNSAGNDELGDARGAVKFVGDGNPLDRRPSEQTAELGNVVQQQDEAPIKAPSPPHQPILSNVYPQRVATAPLAWLLTH